MKELFVKYPKIPHLYSELSILDKPVEVYEKLDGGNAQARKIKGRIMAGNRANFLDDKRFNQFWFPDFLRWIMRNRSLYALPENLIVFFEWLAPHTLDYRNDARNKAYVLDVYDLNQKRFVPYADGRDMLNSLEVKDICYLKPMLQGNVTLGELEEFVLRKDSEYRDADKKTEGVVVKNYASQRFAKLLRRAVLKDKGGVDRDDVMRARFEILESGLKINFRNLLAILQSNLEEERRNYKIEKMKQVVYEFLHKH